MLFLQTLQAHQFAIPSLQRDQLSVRPTLHHLAFFNHVDDIGLLDRAQSMRDRDSCSALCRHVQRVLDHFLRLRVEGRGRLVEQEDLWVAEKGAGDGDTLFLAAREEGGFAAAFGGEAIAREGVSLRNGRQAGIEKSGIQRLTEAT